LRLRVRLRRTPPNGQLRFRCKSCRGDFSLTSGTLFAFRKMPLRTYLTAIVIFCNEMKGNSTLALSRDLDVNYKTAFVLAHKMREAMSTEVNGHQLGAALPRTRTASASASS
jgi:transposase-like protein